MRISVKPSRGGAAFNLEAGPEETVAVLKERVESCKPEMPAQKQKLICGGRILKDNELVKDLGLKPGAELIVYAPKEAAAFAPAARTTAESAVAAAAAAEGTRVPPAAAMPATTEPVATSVDLDASAASRHVSGPAFESTVAQLCEMGFVREDVQRCLAAAYGNPDRAVEYLMSGGPPRAGRVRAADRSADLDAVGDATPAARAAALREVLETPEDRAAMRAAAGGDPMVSARAAAAAAHWPAAISAEGLARLPPTGFEVRAADGWRPWQPGVPVRGEAGEEIRYTLGHHHYTARFNTADSGVQQNVAYGTERPIRRVREAARAPPRAPPVAGAHTREALPPVADNELEFRIRDAHTLQPGEKLLSEPKTVGDLTFRLVVFPRGTAAVGGTQVSAFVEALAPEGAEEDWCFRGVKYSIAVVNWIDYRLSPVKTDRFDFSRGIDRGWHDMLLVSELSSEMGWLGPDNSLLFRASVRPPAACSIMPTEGYSSRRRTGHVNLQSPGDGSCFITSVVQSLFHIPQFRELVLGGAGAGGLLSDPVLQTARSLQEVFRALQTSEAAVDCNLLLAALGFQPGVYGECDLNSYIRALCNGFRGNAIQLFEGQMESRIQCTDVDYRSVRTESFLSLPLSLCDAAGRPLESVEAALDDLVAEEILEGANGVDAGEHGKQRATKSLQLRKLPAVLWLDVKRVKLDPTNLELVKSNAKLEYPERLDLTKYVPGAGSYRLHTVVVHHGGLESGHCELHVNSSTSGRWLKVTEAKVEPSTPYAAIQANFGGDDYSACRYFSLSSEEMARMTRAPRLRPYSACLLGYVREDSA
eukprot:gb/GFBE01006031.1/.p1 GENE.gb/GFBE01006031.1/~~gb/GFBE01006031.1/.p1  ORF type:complete len:818 (+),score=134.62 gb/GFBE01006031.1/:1-2454(+)